MKEDEIKLHVLKAISEAETNLSQRDLAKMLGISLGKINYCLTELTKSGYIKIQRFKKAKKQPYMYLLTSKGMQEKFRLLVHFLNRKMNEYEVLKNQISDIHRSLSRYSNVPGDFPTDVPAEVTAE